MTFEALVLGIIRARLENDHPMVNYFMRLLREREELWSAKHVFEDLANTAEGIHMEGVR